MQKSKNKKSKLLLSLQIVQSLESALPHKPPFKTTPQHSLLFIHVPPFQPVVLAVPVHRPSVPALLFLNSNKTLLVFERQSLFVVCPIPRSDGVMTSICARAVAQLSRLVIRVYPIEFRLCALVLPLF
jgi:hypothetical protein